MVLHFGLKNTGKRSIKVRQIHVVPGYQNGDCFEIRPVMMAIIRPNETLRLSFVMRLSEKTSWGYTAQINIQTQRFNVTMPLRVRFDDFYVAGGAHLVTFKITQAVLFGVIFALLLGLMKHFQILIGSFMQKRTVQPKVTSCVFLGSKDRAEKLELFSHRVKAVIRSPFGPEYPHIWAIPSKKSTLGNPKKPLRAQKTNVAQPKRVVGHFDPESKVPGPQYASDDSNPSLSSENQNLIDELKDNSPKSEEPTPPVSNRRLQQNFESQSDCPKDLSVEHSGREVSTNFRLKKAAKFPESVISLNRVIFGLQSQKNTLENEISEDSQPINSGEIEEEKSIQESLERAFGLQDSYDSDKRLRKYSYRLKPRVGSDAHNKARLNTDFGPSSNITYNTLLEIMQRAQNKMQSK
jgi:hypothetical protein